MHVEQFRGLEPFLADLVAVIGAAPEETESGTGGPRS